MSRLGDHKDRPYKGHIQLKTTVMALDDPADQPH